MNFSYDFGLKGYHLTDKEKDMFTLHRKQKLPVNINEAWSFFSSPKNLKEITPGFMGFDIVSGADKSMFPGQIISYKVKPILNISVTWITEITEVYENKYFVDTQIKGPFSIWHHKHLLEKLKMGLK